MLNQDLTAFFTASVGAAAAFIGLLFVGLTVALTRPGGTGIALRERLLAESSYTSLINVLFVSFVGLFPDPELSWVFLTMGFISALVALRHLKSQLPVKHRVDNVKVLASLLAIYLIQAGYGLWLVLHPGDAISLAWLVTIIFSLYGSALGRAWALTGFDDRIAIKPRDKR